MLTRMGGRHWPAIVAIPVLALGFAVGGCGEEETEEDRVVAAVEQLQEDLADGDFRAVCEGMTERPKRQIGSIGHRRKPTECRFDLSDYVRQMKESGAVYGRDEDLRRARRPQVTDVNVRGDRAVATMTLRGEPFRVPLAKREAAWKLDDFFGAIGPPPRPLR